MIVHAPKRRAESLDPFRYEGLAAADAGARPFHQIALPQAAGDAAAGEVPAARPHDDRQVVAPDHREPVRVGEAVRRGCQVDP